MHKYQAPSVPARAERPTSAARGRPSSRPGTSGVRDVDLPGARYPSASSSSAVPRSKPEGRRKAPDGGLPSWTKSKPPAGAKAKAKPVGAGAIKDKDKDSPAKLLNTGI